MREASPVPSISLSSTSTFTPFGLSGSLTSVQPPSEARKAIYNAFSAYGDVAQLLNCYDFLFIVNKDPLHWSQQTWPSFVAACKGAENALEPYWSNSLGFYARSFTVQHSVSSYLFLSVSYSD